MTKTELQKKIDQLESELAEVKEQVAALPNRVDDGGAFKPEYGDVYRYISAEGTVFANKWAGDSIDHDRYIIGNCFPTEQAAEDTVRVLKLIQKAKESQNGFVPDWEDSIQDKYFLYYETGKIFVINFTTVNVAPIFGYWRDRSTCNKFIDENSDELRWFFTEYRR